MLGKWMAGGKGTKGCWRMGIPCRHLPFPLPITSPACFCDLQGDYGTDADLAGKASSLGLYLQTKTFTGAKVLGVMIHGATLNTTVSVKIGVCGIPWGGKQKSGTFRTLLTTFPPKYPTPEVSFGVN